MVVAMTNTTITATPSTSTPAGSTLVRLALPAGLVAAALGVPSDLYHFTIESRAAASDEFLFMAHGIGLVAAMVLASVALMGLATRAGAVLGAAGRTCVALAYVGTLLVLGNITTEAFQMRLAPEVLDDPTGYSLVVIVVSYALFAIGWFGVALTLGRQGLVSPGVTLLLCLGAVYGFTPFPGSYILLLLGIAAAVVSASRTPGRGD
jgi:hypothetical protein